MTDRGARIGLGGTLILQTGSFGLLFAPLSPSLSMWSWAVLCNLGGWIVLWAMLYVLAGHR